MADDGEDEEGLLMAPESYVAAAVTLFVIGFLGFFCNLVVIVIMCRDKQLWTPLNVILFNLVCSDFSVSILGNPFTLISAIFRQWIFGRVMCILYGFFMSLLVSMTQCIWENQYYDIGATWTKPGECKVYTCEMGSAIIQKVHQPAPNLKWRMCSVLPIGNGCWQVEGPGGAPFPECCPSVQCAGGLPNGGGGGYNVFY